MKIFKSLVSDLEKRLIIVSSDKISRIVNNEMQTILSDHSFSPFKMSDKYNLTNLKNNDNTQNTGYININK